LLGFIGGKMIFESFKNNEEEEACKTDPTRGSSLLLLSVATSIDALAVGLSLGVLKVTIFYPAAIIGFVCFGMTLFGAAIGPVAGKLIGKRAEFAGGLILILIGIKILSEHLV
jgi:putative Mn2+ efflux pump MntP